MPYFYDEEEELRRYRKRVLLELSNETVALIDKDDYTCWTDVRILRSLDLRRRNASLFRNKNKEEQ